MILHPANFVAPKKTTLTVPCYENSIDKVFYIHTFRRKLCSMDVMCGAAALSHALKVCDFFAKNFLRDAKTESQCKTTQSRKLRHSSANMTHKVRS